MPKSKSQNNNRSAKQKKVIADLCMEMTGVTEDVIEAFEYWKQEREALVNFYDMTESQDIIIRKFKTYWPLFLKSLFGRTGKLSAGFVINQKAAEKGGELLELLNNLADISNDNHNEAVELKGKAIQLPLFKLT